MKKIRIVSMMILIAAMLLSLCSCLAGESAYEIALRNGYSGSEAEWLASLNGSDGKNGADGVDGKDGVNGLNGKDGVDGQNGNDGKNGADGKDGENGSDGVGVENVKIDENGYLIITLTNGKTFNAGYVGQATPDDSTEAPKLNATKLNISVGASYILSSDRPSTTYTSSNPSIVQVSSEGLLLALSEGSATITATARDGKTATCIVNSFAYTYENLQSGGIKLTGYNGSLTNITIPENIMGVTVKEIGASMFVGSGITSITLPAGIVKISDNAFSNCQKLSSVTFGTGVTTIGNSAFRNCRSLISVAIPNQVTWIGEYAFADCSGLSEVSIGNGASYNRENTFLNTPWFEKNLKPETPPLNVFVEVNESVWVYPTDNNDVYKPDGFSNYYSDPDRSTTISSLKDKTELTRVAILFESDDGIGWSRLIYQGQTIYMRNSQLTTVRPEQEPIPPEDPDDIYAYDPSAIPNGMVGRFPDDLSASDKGNDNISDFSDAYDPNLDLIKDIDVSSAVPTQGPLVLILHTHATEAYTAPGVAWYAPNGADLRTTDITKNVVSVGALLAEKLNEFGVPTLHCEILHDEDTYTGAYDNSAETIKQYLQQYPTIKYVIDLHRDFIQKTSGEIVRPITEVGGEAVAQIMCVVGTGATMDGGNDRWESNLALAQKLRSELNASTPKLCRPTYLRDSGYNQQLAPFSLLIEMGSSANTVDDVKNSVELLAPALATVIKGE